ncbi:MAG TPA: hypothetical protein VF482_15335 [Trebonia sp.]
MKEAPAQALRAMFAGIGQLMAATDKLRGKPAQAPATAEAAAKAPKTTAANGAATASKAVVTTETVTVEAPAPETTVEAAAPAPAGAKVDELAVEEAPPVAAAEPVAEAVPAEPAAVAEPAVAEPAVAAATPAAELPLANYDGLTVASLRARLRNLSVAQLGQLIAYEKANADRADVIAMFERRVAKLESES